jgi:hypothetical protein
MFIETKIKWNKIKYINTCYFNSPNYSFKKCRFVGVEDFFRSTTCITYEKYLDLLTIWFRVLSIAYLNYKFYLPKIKLSLNISSCSIYQCTIETPIISPIDLTWLNKHDNHLIFLSEKHAGEDMCPTKRDNWSISLIEKYWVVLTCLEKNRIIVLKFMQSIFLKYKKHDYF